MSKHTPGPWEFHPASNYCGHAIAPLGTLPTLCAVERPAGSGSMCNITAHNFPGSTEANARLIAAAPELLEAHEVGEAVEALFLELAADGRLDCRTDAVNDLCEAFQRYQDARKAAIAKATGTGHNDSGESS